MAQAILSTRPRASAGTSASASHGSMWPGGGDMRGSLGLRDGLVGLLAVVELGRDRLGGLPTERLLDEPAGLPALGAGEPPGLDLRLARRADGDLNRLHEAPPTLMVSL